MSDVVGPVEREFLRMGRSYVAHAMVAIGLAVQAVALLAVDRAQMPVQLSVLAVTAAWSAYGLARLRGRAPAWTVAADIALIATFCLAQPVLEVRALARLHCGWVPMATEAFIVGAAWIYPRRVAGTATGLLAVAYLVGALLLGEGSNGVVVLLALWLVVTGVLSGIAQGLVHRTGRRIDEATARSELAKQEAAVARARREAQAEHLATLHDTVAATLLMVGQGGVRPADDAWLREQAGRDLAVLVSTGPGDAEPTLDLETELRAVARTAALAIDLHCRGPVAAVPAAVAAALTGAAGEALRNASRHAGVETARVDLLAGDGTYRITVRDTGPGFADGARPGRGLRFSITERVARVGGRAAVTSSPDGVRVVLEWPVAGPAEHEAAG